MKKRRKKKKKRRVRKKSTATKGSTFPKGVGKRERGKVNNAAMIKPTTNPVRPEARV